MRLTILPLVVFLSIALVGRGERPRDNELIRISNTKTLKTMPKARDVAVISKHSISKRGWGSLIFLGTTTALRLGALGVNIAAAVSRGCSFFDSICKNLELIAKLEANSKREREEFKALYANHSKNFWEFRTAATNNGFINYYINDTLKKVESLDSWQNQLGSKLEAFYPKSMDIMKFGNQSKFNEYLYMLSIERLEYTLNDINIMLRDQQKMQLIGMVVQLLGEAAINRFVESFKKAYTKVIVEPVHSLFDTELQRELGGDKDYDIKAAGVKKYTFAQRLKAVPQAFKQMAINLKTTMRKVLGKIKQFIYSGRNSKVSRWNRVKGHFQAVVRKTINGLKTKINSLKTKLSPKNFQVSKSFVVLSVFGLVADAATITLTMLAWKKKAEEIEKAKNQYEKRLADLKREKMGLLKEIARMSKEWETLIHNFKNTSEAFESTMQKMNNYSNFIDIVGLSKLSIKNAENILSVNFQNVSRKNVIHSQRTVLKFLRENDHNLTAVKEALRARSVLYDYVIKSTKKGEGVQQMTKFLHSLYRFDASTVLRKFGEKLRKKDVVCTVAIIRVDKETYDYYPLSPFRPKCEVNDTYYATMDQAATKQQNMKIMNDVIDIELEKESVVGLSELLTTVRNTYRIQGELSLTKFAKSITEKDILCRISSKFTTMAEFDFIPLSSFRTKCPDISDNDLKILKEKASKIKKLQKSLTSTMDICTTWKFCPCIQTISTMYGANKEDIKATIKRLNPDLKEYCGTTGCQCIIL